MSILRNQLIGECLGEVLGTFALILMGDGIVAAAVFLGTYDPMGVAWVWGLGVMIAVYLAAGVSGAHLNPAVSVAFAVFRRFPKWKVIPFVLAQVVGAFLGAATVFYC